MNDYSFNDLNIGTKEQFEVKVTEEMQNSFTLISGDINPMHLDSDFAIRGGGIRTD